MLLSGVDFQKEIINVINILSNNDYPRRLIFSRIKVLYNKSLTMNQSLDNSEQNDKYVCLPYVKNLSEKLGKVFREHKYDVRYCRLENDIYSKLYNHKDPIPNMHKSGVYRDRKSVV